MIQPTAPTPVAGAIQTVGKANGASPEAAGAGSFLTILGMSAGAEAAAEEVPSATDGALAGLMLPVAGGNLGKAGGKILPVAAADPDLAPETDTPSGTGDDDTGLQTVPSEAALDSTGTPMALAGMLPLPLPPLPGAESVTTIEPRAAATDRTGTDTAASSSAAVTAALTQQISQTQTQPAATAAKAPNAPQPATQGSPLQATSMQTATLQATPIHILSAQTAATKPVAAPVVTLAPIEIVPDSDAKATGSTPSAIPAQPAVTAVQLAARHPLATAAATVTPVQADDAAPTAAIKPRTGRRDTGLETASTPSATDAKPAVRMPAETASTAPASPLPLIAEPAQIRSTGIAAPGIVTSAAATAQAAESPQDFATLVDRLNEAREAAGPQLVRTAVTHAQFGRISLQFRHEDNGLAVTMANSDPSFTSAVHAAANASLAGNANGNGDDAGRQQQQQSQNQASSQQQAASASGAGAGTGNGSSQQHQQARADQAGQQMNRGQGTASRPNDNEASAPRQTRDGTRNGGGIYA